MISETHTPGPWQVIGTDPAEGGDWFWIKAQPSPVMRGFSKEIGVVNGSQSDPTQIANARLIAAAPDGLAANKAFVAAVESGAGVQDGMTPDQAYTEVLIQYGHGVATAYDAARAALAKAEGRS